MLADLLQGNLQVGAILAADVPPLVREAIKALDEALGRPPFPSSSPPSLRAHGMVLEQLVARAGYDNTIAELKAAQEVTSTLPVLVASLKMGSMDERPCLHLYRHVVGAFSALQQYSTYPPKKILADATAILDAQDPVLFVLTSSIGGGLGPEQMCAFLKLPPPAAGNAAATVREGKRKKGGGHEKGAAPTMATVAATIPHSLLRAMLSVSLPADCETILLDTLRGTAAFRQIVDGDSTVAEAILKHFGTTLLPTYDLSCLIPCMSPRMLPYFVQLAEQDDHHMQEHRSVFEHSQFVEEAAQQWSIEAVAELAEALAGYDLSGAVGPPYGLLLTVVFVMQTGIAKDGNHCTASTKWLQLLWCAAARATAAHLKQAPGAAAIRTDANGVCFLEGGDATMLWLRAMDVLVGVSVEREWFPLVGMDHEPHRAALTALWSALLAHIEETTRRPPTRMPAPKKAAAPPPPQTAKSSGSKGKGKGKGGKKAEKEPAQAAVPVPAPPAGQPATASYAAYLQHSARLLLALNALLPAPTLSTGGLLVLLKAFDLTKRTTTMAGAVWTSFLHYAASSFRHLTVDDSDEGLAALASSTPALRDTFFATLRNATQLTNRMRWVGTVLLCPASTDKESSHPLFHPKQWPHALVKEIVDAALRATDSGREELSWVEALYPSTPRAALGQLCHRLPPEQLAHLAGTVASSSVVASIALLDTFLQRSDATDTISPPELEGLHRLRDALAEQHSVYMNDAAYAAATREEEQQAALAAQVAREQRLAAQKASFDAANTAREATLAQAAAAVREERKRQHAAAAARRKEELERQARMLRLAEAAMREASDASREAAMVRFRQYQERTKRHFQVVRFLESLGLPSRRIIEIDDALTPVMHELTPDGLLEFLVTGSASVPPDMEDGSTVEPQETVAAAQPATFPTGHFWDEVMGAAPSHAPLSEADEAVAIAAAAQRLSFHRRVTPLLDLFCFEDGDEFGAVPDPLPMLNVRAATRAVDHRVMVAHGFSSVTQALDALKAKGLVVYLHGGRTVQLTCLGFRYHFPYHDRDAMLEVRLARHRNHLMHLMASRRTTGGEGGDSNYSHEDDEEEDEDEEWEWISEYDDDEDDEAGILPEVAFKI